MHNPVLLYSVFVCMNGLLVELLVEGEQTVRVEVRSQAKCNAAYCVHNVLLL